jgi:FtsP/CotA-like multicopper oxidase with cupredoxin domain
MLGVSAMVAAAVGVVAVTVAVSGDDSGSSSGVAATSPAAEAATVELSEFAISPDPITVAPGGEVTVTNAGSIEHNLAIAGEDVRTANLPSGESGTLDLGDLAPGEYEVLCEIPGHADAGMRATLTIAEGAGGAAAPAGDDGGSHAEHGSDAMDYQALTDAMLDSMNAFPAETAGVGNQELAPTEVLPDGTKVFDLTMQLADWEVEPGKVVEAWTFNGMVPGPLIRLDVGDRMQLRVHNELPLATDVHLHGLNVENRFDGVAPFTQDLIEPGESFTYEYVADEQAVAMYHPHAHGHMLLPNGMFGGILVGDVRLPRGQTVGLEQIPADVQVAQEIPMVLNDSGVIGFSLNGKSFPATKPITAKVGDWVLIHYWNEGNQIHPMHLHQFDQIVVAKDGYPVDAPYTVDTLNVAPGERYSVLVHVDKPGTWVWHCHILPHVERDDAMFGMVTAFVVE